MYILTNQQIDESTIDLICEWEFIDSVMYKSTNQQIGKLADGVMGGCPFTRY